MSIKHSFYIEIAEKHGVNCAIIYDNLMFWCTKNKANSKNFHDGNFWTYNSVDAWGKLFPYFGASQIKSALKKLEESGLISSANYNISKYDRTKWYSIVELSVLANGNDDNSQPIPDNKPDEKQKQQKKKIKSLDTDIKNKIAEYKNINIQALNEWLEIKKFKTITPITKTLNMLSEYDEQVQQQIVDTSIMNNWKGLFEPKGIIKKSNTKQQGWS